MARVQLKEAIEARSLCEEEFFLRRNVVAVAVGLREVEGKETDEPCVKAFVIKKIEPSTLPEGELLPRSVSTRKQKKVPVDVKETGLIWAWGLRQKVRPAMGGYSVAHFQVTAGTIATAVRDSQRDGVFSLLSNNHVLANSNAARLGDPLSSFILI